MDRLLQLKLEGIMLVIALLSLLSLIGPISATSPTVIFIISVMLLSGLWGANYALAYMQENDMISQES